MDVKQESTQKHLYLPYLTLRPILIAALSEASEKLTGERGTQVGRHNGQKMNTAF